MQNSATTSLEKVIKFEYGHNRLTDEEYQKGMEEGTLTEGERLLTFKSLAPSPLWGISSTFSMIQLGETMAFLH